MNSQDLTNTKQGQNWEIFSIDHGRTDRRTERTKVQVLSCAFAAKQALRRFLWAAQLKYDLDACNMHTLYNQSANIVQKHCLLNFYLIFKFLIVQVYRKPVYCTSVHITSSLYKCTQNQLTVQVYTNQFTVQVYTNQFTVQVYTKPVHCTSVHKTSF